MIKEAYVSFAVATLLKEKGFDEKCFTYYSKDCKAYVFNTCGVAERINNTELPIYSPNLIRHECIRPTHQMALAWLREKGIIIVLDYNADEDCEKNEHWGFSTYTNSLRKVNFATYPTYEEAVEAALKYSLENLI